MRISYFVIVEVDGAFAVSKAPQIERQLAAALEHSTAAEALSEALQREVRLRMPTDEDFDR